jgi:starch synthase (maltosyl-transferring)
MTSPRQARGVEPAVVRRVAIENVTPAIDAGRFAIKRTSGESVVVEADVFSDGHDAVRCMLRYRAASEPTWREVEMQPCGNDRWRASFSVESLGEYVYSVTGWTDRFETWRRDLQRRVEASDVIVALRVGAELFADCAARATGPDAARLTAAADALAKQDDAARGREFALSESLQRLAAGYPDRRYATDYARELRVTVDPPLARFGAWYEFFPRSTAAEAGQHGTFSDCETWLPYVQQMGFDIVYLPPIHPIGRIKRKGPNNSTNAGPGDPGSPWAIGATEGGHCAVHPQLGTLADFRRFVEAARRHHLQVALDIAFQCAPDHPYVQEHPEWFQHRPDGSVQYAENPPKKYQDIYPFDFETPAWLALRDELTGVVRFWAGQGVTVFRVDNPHTKPYALWEYLIAQIKREYPEAIFLSEAFTRPKVMHRLAKLGFTQSYTYFTWRNTKHELTQYFTELSRSPSREYFRPAVWPNTPDILSEYLQTGGRPAFMARAVLAATLSATYGIYGPAFELQEAIPREPGSEEYLDSEKYQIRRWQRERRDSLRGLITRLNEIRRNHPALQSDWSLRFIDIDNPQLLAYLKCTADLADVIVTVVNLDPHHAHEGWLELPLDALGLAPAHAYRVEDLLSGASYLWQGNRTFVRLDPQGVFAHVFQLRRYVRSESDFDYFL